MTDYTEYDGTWTIDASHTRLGFIARHAMVTKVRGSFNEFEGSGRFDTDQPENSNLSVTIQVASIDTGNADRDGHLRTNDFFDVERYPTMSLRSTGFEAHGDQIAMRADLTIKGVTKQVVFELEFEGVGQDPWGGTRAGFSATATIHRGDFGIEFNAALETGGVLVGDKIRIELDVQLVKS